jgi:hypothetical protein
MAKFEKEIYVTSDGAFFDNLEEVFDDVDNDTVVGKYELVYIGKINQTLVFTGNKVTKGK